MCFNIYGKVNAAFQVLTIYSTHFKLAGSGFSELACTHCQVRLYPSMDINHLARVEKCEIFISELPADGDDLQSWRSKMCPFESVHITLPKKCNLLL